MIWTVEAQRTQRYQAKIEADSREEAERVMREMLPIMLPDTEDFEVWGESCPMASYDPWVLVDGKPRRKEPFLPKMPPRKEENA
jgi:hypothetical protein